MKKALILCTVLASTISFSFAYALPRGIAKVTEDFRVNENTGNNNVSPIIVFDQNTSQFYVSWGAVVGGIHTVYYRKFSATGTPIGGDVRVSDLDASPSITAHGLDIAVNQDGQLLISWMDTRNWLPELNGNNDIYYSLFEPDGDLILDNQLIIPNVEGILELFPGNDPDPDYNHSHEHLTLIPFIAYGPDYDHYSFLVSVSDEATGPDNEDEIAGVIDHFFGPSQYAVAFHVDDNGFPELPNPVASGKGSAAVDAQGNVLFVFYDSPPNEGTSIRGQRFDVEVTGFEFAFTPVGFNYPIITTGHHGEPNIWIQNSTNCANCYVVSFTSRTDPDNRDLQFLRFNSEDEPIEGDYLRTANVTTDWSPGSHKYLDGFEGGQFLLVWEGLVNAQPDIYCRAYDSGTPASPLSNEEFPMNNTLYNAYSPALATGPGDKFAVAWCDDRRGAGILDIYAALFQFDLDPPQITGTTVFSPPAKIYDPPPSFGYWIYANSTDDASGLESVWLVYTMEIPPIFHQLSYTDSVEMQPYGEFPGDFRGKIPAPDDPGTDIKYFVRARDLAKNPQRDPHSEDDFFTIAVNELGDLNGDGCHRWSDLSLLEERIGEDPMAGPVENFFADIDQDDDIDCDDYDELEMLIGSEDYPECVPRIVAYPENFEIAATEGGQGDTGILLPVYLDNDSSEVGSIFFTMVYDSSVFKLDTLTLTQRTSGFTNVVQDCRSGQLPPGEEEVLLSGGAESVVSQGTGEIANFSLTVDPAAPAGKYHFTLKQVALVDSLNEEVESVALRGKFFIPEAPPVSIICTPLSDTSLMRGDTLIFNTTLTNHHWEGVTASVYMYGTVHPDGGSEFLVVDTTYVYLPPHARISSITQLEVIENAPITHYVFTGYVGENSTIYDDDSFGFDVEGGAGMGIGGSELAGSGYRTMWPLISGWFEEERAGRREQEEIGKSTSPTIPKTFATEQNYPNPFNPSTRIVYDIPDIGSEGMEVTVWIYDVRGKVVRTYEEGCKKAGRHSILWDGRDNRGNELGSGNYFYRLQVGDFEEIRKMVLVK